MLDFGCHRNLKQSLFVGLPHSTLYARLIEPLRRAEHLAKLSDDGLSVLSYFSDSGSTSSPSGGQLHQAGSRVTIANLARPDRERPCCINARNADHQSFACIGVAPDGCRAADSAPRATVSCRKPSVSAPAGGSGGPTSGADTTGNFISHEQGTTPSLARPGVGKVGILVSVWLSDRFKCLPANMGLLSVYQSGSAPERYGIWGWSAVCAIVCNSQVAESGDTFPRFSPEWAAPRSRGEALGCASGSQIPVGYPPASVAETNGSLEQNQG